VGKRLSQIELANRRVASRIVGALAAEGSDTVIEFGAGGGALTELLVDSLARVIAIEVDRLRCRRLKSRWPHLRVVCQDLLTFDLGRVARVSDRRPKLIGNLPYHISGPALVRIAAQAPAWSRAVVTLQREVAMRLVARPGSRVYGRLTVMVTARVEARMLFGVAPGSFRPRPKVHSAVVELEPRPHPLVPDALQDAFYEVVRGAFASRRKMVRNTRVGRELKGRGVDQLLCRRAEELSVADFRELAHALSSSMDGGG
jgi:16S rRNA (adenine1518-N6/adenine1519-N6)-dimethyltransferase